ASARLHHFIAEQADFQVHRPINDRAVCRKPAVGDAKHKLAAHDPFDVDAVDPLLDGGQDLTGKFQLAQPECASPARRSEPAQEEAEQLPQRIKAQAARHDRIAFEGGGKNRVAGLISSTARTSPLPYSPPASAISEMRSNMSMGGKGNWALPAPNNSPRAHANRSSYPKLLRRSAIRVLS